MLSGGTFIRIVVVSNSCYKINKKVKQIILRTMEACRVSRGIAPLILDLVTRWKRVVRFTPRPLYAGRKSLCYPLVEIVL
jgi:hypothetical protein